MPTISTSGNFLRSEGVTVGGYFGVAHVTLHLFIQFIWSFPPVTNKFTVMFFVPGYFSQI